MITPYSFVSIPERDGGDWDLSSAGRSLGYPGFQSLRGMEGIGTFAHRLAPAAGLVSIPERDGGDWDPSRLITLLPGLESPKFANPDINSTIPQIPAEFGSPPTPETLSSRASQTLRELPKLNDRPNPFPHKAYSHHIHRVSNNTCPRAHGSREEN